MKEWMTGMKWKWSLELRHTTCDVAEGGGGRVMPLIQGRILRGEGGGWPHAPFLVPENNIPVPVLLIWNSLSISWGKKGCCDPLFPDYYFSCNWHASHSSHLIIWLCACARDSHVRHQMWIWGRKNWVIPPPPIKRTGGRLGACFKFRATELVVGQITFFRE